MLDRRSVVQQLEDGLRALIAEDALRPGDRLPSETEISSRFGVARGTVREALRLLEESGLVEAQHGRGHFVSAAGLSVDRPVTEFESVTEMLSGLGYHPATVVLDVSTAPATDAEREALDLERGAGVVRIQRMRMLEGRALVYQVNAFDAALLGPDELGGVDFSGSLNAWLSARDRAPVSSAARIRARSLPPAVADRPELTGPEPWLLITERCVDRSGVPVLFSQDYHRGDVFSFHVLRRRGARRGTAYE